MHGMISNSDSESGDTQVSVPVDTGVHPFAPWLTVQEAVAYCVDKGLPRTPKTVRKWAQRSVEAAPGAGDVVVQRQDTENGFRWLISRESLDVKIEQEKEFSVRVDDEVDGSNGSEHVATGSNLLEPVATRAHMFAQGRPQENTELSSVHVSSNSSEPVRTAELPDGATLVDFLTKQLERAERQLDVKDKQIDALLERDRETNVLIQGLQTSLTGVVNALPSGNKSDRVLPQTFPPHHGDQGTQVRDA
jgi:hypothetical protein